jgi:hypothetical protein
MQAAGLRAKLAPKGSLSSRRDPACRGDHESAHDILNQTKFHEARDALLWNRPAPKALGNLTQRRELDGGQIGSTENPVHRGSLISEKTSVEALMHATHFVSVAKAW